MLIDQEFALLPLSFLPTHYAHPAPDCHIRGWWPDEPSFDAVIRAAYREPFIAA